MWCVACFSAEQRSSGKCRECFSRASVCHHCGQNEADLSNNFKCSESKCAAVFSFCLRCRPYFDGNAQLQCKQCWHASGDLCIGCSSQAQNNLDKFRYCKRCIADTFCPECSLPPAAVLNVPKCRACGKLALLCGNMSRWKGGRAGCVPHISEPCPARASFALSGMLPTNSCGGRARVLIAPATSALARNAASMSQTTR